LWHVIFLPDFPLSHTAVRTIVQRGPRVSLDLDANRIILLDRVTTNESETEQIPF
jgi:hypothetical protein